MSVHRSSQVGAEKIAKETKKNRKWIIIKAIGGGVLAIVGIIGLILKSK